jgi:glutathione-regulated potassium-efflux system ancillary protein KefG
MKTLVILAHPNLENSRVNKVWAERLQTVSDVRVHDLYAAYSGGKVDVEKEQALLLEHDRIVFQFPLYWYSTPALLKQWQDQVLTYGWAYGSTGNKLHGKEFMAVLSAGGPAEAYQAGGYNRYTISELLRPLQAMANLTGMNYLPPFTLHGTHSKTDEDLTASAEQLAALIN